MKISNILSKRNRVLLRELVVTDFKLRYQGSVLGYLWSLLKPLFLFAILYTVFGLVLRLGTDVEHFPVYLLLGIVLWSFFNEATKQGLSSIVDRGDLIRKINFPKYIIVISGTLSALINLLINLVVIAFLMYLNGVQLTGNVIWFPLLLIELYVISLALAFLLSAFYVKFRDFDYIWEVVMQAAFYAVPIIYPLSLVVAQSDQLAKILMLNPIAQIIQDSRYVLVTTDSIRLYDLLSNAFVIAIPFIVTIFLLVIAAMYFKKKSKYFAEDV